MTIKLNIQQRNLIFWLKLGKSTLHYPQKKKNENWDNQTNYRIVCNRPRARRISMAQSFMFILKEQFGFALEDKFFLRFPD